MKAASFLAWVLLLGTACGETVISEPASSSPSSISVSTSGAELSTTLEATDMVDSEMDSVYCESVVELSRVLPDGMGDEVSDERVEPSAEVKSVYSERLARAASLAPADHVDLWTLLASDFSYESLDLLEEKLEVLDDGCQGVVFLVIRGSYVYDFFATTDQVGAGSDDS